MSINPPQCFDWTVRNLHKAFNEWLEEVNLFFEFQKFESEGRDNTTKATNVEKKKRSLFIYLLGKKGRQIYKTLTIKNAKGETIENDDEKKTRNGYRNIQGLLQTHENIDCRQSGIPTERTK